jgi:carbon monoxide dehydrogenase subunit G
MRLEGTIVIAAPARQVWEVVTDPTGIAGCVPGVKDMRMVEDGRFEGSISASVGPLNGDFSFQSVITRAEYPGDLHVEVDGTDSVTRSRLVVAVQAGLVEDGPSQTTLTYDADVKVKGRLAILGEMILRATASMMIGQVTRCLRTRLEAPAAPATPVEPAP